MQLEAFGGRRRGDAEQIGQANFLFGLQQHGRFAGGLALLDRLLNPLFLLSLVRDWLTFFAVCPGTTSPIFHPGCG